MPIKRVTHVLLVNERARAQPPPTSWRYEYVH